MEGPMVRAREFRFVVVASDYEAATLLFRDVFEFEALMALRGSRVGESSYGFRPQRSRSWMRRTIGW
jgi:hypothetical protein